MATTAPHSTRALAPPRAAAVAGVAFSVLMSVSLVVVRLAVPRYQADAGAWVSDPSRLKAVRFAIDLVPFAGIAFLWFIGVFRNRLGALEDRFFATVFLGSGLLFVACFFASGGFAAALLETLANGHLHPESELYYLTRQLTGVFMNVFAIKMAGMFIFSTSMIAFRTAILPRWLAVLGFCCGIALLLVITSWPWIALLFPAWILVVSARILLGEFRPVGPKLAP